MREAPSRLRCEYQENPLGIDTPRPRLSWWLDDARPAELQTAYQIQASSSPAGLQSGVADLWDTGHVSSRQTVNVEYRGRGLGAGDRVWWRVRCYDSDGTPSPWSEPARFELGLGEPDDWRASWIASPLTGSPASPVPVPILYRDFELSAAPTTARLHLAVLGSPVVEVNGRPVTASEPLEPWYDLGRRVPCRVYDVTELLGAGSNRVAVLLGDGGYCGHTAGGPRQRYGERPALAAQLVVDQQGVRHTVVSDTGWRWRPSWVLSGDRDRGEEVDGRQVQADWSRPGGALGYPVVEETPAVERVAARTPPARVVAELEPVASPLRWRAADGRTRWRYDFGRSVLGRVRVRLRSARGDTLAVSYALEAPASRPDGRDPAEARWETTRDVYTCRGGDDEECFEPRFALHAFRFLEIVADQELRILSVSALEVATAAPATAALRCDHRLLDQLFEAAQRTYRLGLSLGPVAALSADRRRASVADSQAVLTGAAVCLDVASIYWDWLTGLADAQTVGDLPALLPDGGDASGEPEHVEALLPCLWFVYRCYGDHRLLELQYPVVQRYLQGLRQRWPDLIRGDPAEPLPGQMLGTAWYAYALSLAARMAGVLGRLGDLEAYEALADRVRMAFRGRFLTGDGLLASDDQLGYVLGLALGLFDDGERAAALARLEAQLRGAGFHPSLDLRYGALLLEVLTLEGRADLAYQVLLQTTAPSWLHPLHAGADVLWDVARDQPGRLALGCVAGWLLRFLLGLELDDNLTPEVNAYRRMRIQPRPPLGPAFSSGWPVRDVSGHLDTVHGRYECAWQITEEAFELQVRVPGNGSARVILPDGSESVVMAGTHEFSVAHEQGGNVAPPQAAEEIPVLREISGGG